MLGGRSPVGEIRVVSYEEAEPELLRVAKEYAQERQVPWDQMEKILADLRDGVERGVYEVGLDELDHPFVKEVPQAVLLWN